MVNPIFPQKPSLTFADAVEVWRLHKQGMYQHVIASRFGVNPGRVNEVLKGHNHIGSKELTIADMM